MKFNAPKAVRVHVALRIVPQALVGSQKFDVIKEHNRLIAEHGQVAFAKFGVGLGKPSLTYVSAALDSGQRPFLLAICIHGGQVFASRAPISNVVVNSKPWGFRSPEYYKELRLVASCWFILSGLFEPCSLTGLYLVSNHRSLNEVIAASRATMMVVYQVGRLTGRFTPEVQKRKA